MMESVSSMETSGDFTSEAFDELEDGEVEDGELVDDGPKDCEDSQSTESDKLILRARRFGLTGDSTKPNTNPELEIFHKSMGVDKDTRTEALHLLGTDNMKTVDVFAYFSGYSPASLEWISDKSCNVVWLDEESCAKALKNRSIKIKGLSEYDNSDDSEESISIEDIRCALPPGIWRKGHSNSLAPHLFIRYATRYDKKGMKPQNVRFFGNGTYNRSIFLDEGDEVAKKIRHETGNPWADLARQWSHFESRAQSAVSMKDAREVLNHRDSKKTRYSLEQRLHAPFIKDEDIETKPSLLTSRKMQADIEEKKIQERNKLKSNLTLRDRPEIDLRERLGRKRKRNDLIDYDEPVAEWKEDFVSPPEREDISLRIEIDNSRDGSDNEREDSRSMRSSDSDEIATRPNTGDLRSKLEKKKSSHHKKDSNIKSVLRTKYIKHSKSESSPSFPLLRIEIDNDVYQKSSDEED